MERKKNSVVLEKKYISKKQPELNELRQTVLIIIFRYFPFFLDLTVYFLILLFNHYLLLLFSIFRSKLTKYCEIL